MMITMIEYEKIAEFSQIAFIILLAIGAITYTATNSYIVLGYASIITLVIAMLIAPYTIHERVKIIAKKLEEIKEVIAIENIIPLSNLEALKPARFRLVIKNPLKTFGLRLRFRSYDYVNPSSLDLLIGPGEKTEKEIIIVPSGSGRREFSVAIAPLYDENKRLIPDHEADDIAIQKFAFEADEPTIGILSSKQRSILNSIIRFAIFFSASGLVYLSILKISGMEALIYVLTEIIPFILILQVPALMVLFFLEKRLPEKPSFIFEEE